MGVFGRGVRVPSVSLEGLKWGALALMVVDHLALLLFPGEVWPRLPGRVVFPALLTLMAWHLHRGVDPGKYASRLLPFALLAQGGYALVFDTPWFWPLNVLFTFLSGVWMVQGKIFPGVLLSLMTEFPLGGPALYFLSRGQLFWGAVMAGGASWLMGWPLWVALGVFLLTLFLWTVVAQGVPGRRVPWWWAYLFYPLHLWILGGLKWLGVFSR